MATEAFFARKRTRTSTPLRALVPETSVSTNFTIRAEDEDESNWRVRFCQYMWYCFRQIVTEALKEKRRKVAVRSAQNAFVREIMEISEGCSRLKVLDSRSEDEILGYDGTGLFDGN